MSAAIQARRLVVAHAGRRVVDGLDLEVQPGCIYALLGGNGAGKTTAINALCGFVAHESGEVLIGGISLMDRPDAIRRLAYLPENVALYTYMSGLENLRYFCALAGLRIGAANARELLLKAGLPDDAIARRVAEYSKGMRQKVGLSIAYAREAAAMLLDEPTSGLDPYAANDFARRIRAAGEAGIAVLMATHDLFNAKQVADRIGILKAGRIVAEIDTDTVSHQELEDAYLAHARALS